MDKIIIAIVRDNVVIRHNGVTLIQPLSKYKDMSKEEILLKYKKEREAVI